MHCNNVDLMVILMESGADENDDEAAILEFALKHNQCAAVVEMLLKSRAGKGSDQLDALLLLTAEHNESGDVIKILIGNGADVRAVDKYLQTPLVIAARHNPSAGVISALVECGADLDVRNEDQSTPLHIAARYNTAGVVKVFIILGVGSCLLSSVNGFLYSAVAVQR